MLQEGRGLLGRDPGSDYAVQVRTAFVKIFGNMLTSALGKLAGYFIPSPLIARKGTELTKLLPKHQPLRKVRGSGRPVGLSHSPRR